MWFQNQCFFSHSETPFPRIPPSKGDVGISALQLFQTYRMGFLVTPCLEKNRELNQMLMKSYPNCQIHNATTKTLSTQNVFQARYFKVQIFLVFQIKQEKTHSDMEMEMRAQKHTIFKKNYNISRVICEISLCQQQNTCQHLKDQDFIPGLCIQWKEIAEV